jgi:formylglycine-generating enzyme required for sulfatase activity
MIWRGLLFCAALLATGPGFAADTFRDCPECPEMVVIPPGSFTLGSPSSEGRVYSNEGPQRRVTIGHAFAAGIYDITFDQWYACIAGGGCNGYWPEDQGWGRGNRPVINVSWEDAQRYVRWLNDKLRSSQQAAAGAADAGPYRLLTEAEWEYAARAGTTTAYYWGDTRGNGNANCDGCGSQWDNKQTAPVGSFPPNPFGLYDMAGNVLQWVEDCYHENYARAPVDGSAWITGNCNARVMRGGSWYNSTYYLRAANRYSNAPGFHGLNIGFRVAKAVD